MNETTMTTRPDGSREWWVDGRLHRTDGPALEWADGSREWWVDGRLHRTDGPAVEWADGTREWWVDGKRHRSDWPALVPGGAVGEPAAASGASLAELAASLAELAARVDRLERTAARTDQPAPDAAAGSQDGVAPDEPPPPDEPVRREWGPDLRLWEAARDEARGLLGLHEQPRTEREWQQAVRWAITHGRVPHWSAAKGQKRFASAKDVLWWWRNGGLAEWRKRPGRGGGR